jgi:DNA uptake protein ComE-like DNA-binding protein
MKTQHRTFAVLAALIWIGAWPFSVRAQVGKGLLDPNVASEAELKALPGMTPAIVTRMIANRPFLNVLELNSFLTGEKVTPQQAAEFYKKAFVHINLNTGTREEFMLIPGAGSRMAHEFDEYRPWKTWSQFDKEIGKYVGQQETNRFKQYMFIPINLNAATDEDFLTIPGTGPRMVHEFKEYRPWKSKEQFDREIGKYAAPKEVARLWRYFLIQ